MLELLFRFSLRSLLALTLTLTLVFWDVVTSSVFLGFAIWLGRPAGFAVVWFD